MKINNLGRYFNKGYYEIKYNEKKDYLNVIVKEEKKEEKKEEGKENEEKNKEIEPLLDNKINNKILSELKKLEEIFSKTDGFQLKTSYPGLLIGVGYSHNSLSEGEFQNGFYFDYTTGLPMVPGSSVKGVLRDAFPNNEILEKTWFQDLIKNNKEDFEDYDKFQEKFYNENNESDIMLKYRQYCIQKSKIEYISDILGIEYKDYEKIKILESEIFERKGDIFFDAYPIFKESDSILADDYISKHINSIETEEDDLLQNPNPIRFLKLSPDLEIKFNFKIKNTSEILKSKDGDQYFIVKTKKKLFKKILTDFGIGARRTVGYGQLKDSEMEKLNEN